MRSFLKAIKSFDPGLLKPLEALAAPPLIPQRSSDAPLIILLAAPRSGSTFCYQLMCHRFEVDYFSNLIYMGARYPFLSTRIGRRWCSPYVSDFRSDYGFVAGLNGPAEANDIWGEWFDQRLVESSPDPEEKRLSRGLNYFDWAFGSTGRPFLTGWVGHILYAEQMASLFPKAIFVSLERDTQDVAVSLLRARRKKFRDLNQWFSTRSRDCLSEPSSDPFHDVARQVISLQRRAMSFADAYADRVLRLKYEDLCRDPEHGMKRLAQFCSRRQIRLSMRRDTPDMTGYRAAPRVDEDYCRIQKALEDLSKKGGEADEG